MSYYELLTYPVFWGSADSVDLLKMLQLEHPGKQCCLCFSSRHLVCTQANTSIVFMLTGWFCVLFCFVSIFANLFLFHPHECFACMVVGIPHACFVPTEARKYNQIPWTRVSSSCELCGVNLKNSELSSVFQMCPIACAHRKSCIHIQKKCDSIKYPTCSIMSIISVFIHLQWLRFTWRVSTK